MKSVTLSCEEKGWFNSTLLRKNITRFWPLWAVYFAALFFSLTMPVVNLSFRLMDSNGKGLTEAQILEEYRYLIRDGMETAVILGLIFGCLFAMAFFSYLMNRRSVGMIHALPVRREGLFLTNVLSGVLCVTVPAVAVFVISVCVEWGKGAVNVGDLALWLAVTVSVTLFFFGFGTFCAMFTGNLLALPVFYGILNFLVMGMETLLQCALEELWFGYTVGNYSAFAEWCTPTVFLYERVSDWTAVTAADGSVLHDLTGGALTASLYAVVLGLLFLLGAFLVYRTRQMERAEDLVTVGWVRPIFRYGLGVCVGFALGEFLAAYFFDGGAWSLVLLITLCAVLGGFVGQMLLKKTLRVLRSGWKGSLALGLCVFALMGVLKLDLLGYQTKVPSADEVERVTVRGVWSSPYDGADSLNVTVDDPEQVERVLALHQWVAEHLEQMEDSSAVWSDSVGLKVTYRLKNGTKMVRNYYTIPIWERDLEESDSFASMLTEFIEQPKILWDSYFYKEISAENAAAVGGTVYELTSGREERTLDSAEAQLLWEAVREDINAGRYHRYLFASSEKTEENILNYELNLDLYDGGSSEKVAASINIRAQSSATATVAALEKLGLTKTE